MNFRLLIAAFVLHCAVCPGGERYAVVVGVASYRSGQPLPKLSYAENDATKLAKTLQDGGYLVTLMTQSRGRSKGNEVFTPMCDYIRDQLDAVLDNPNLTKDDVVMLAFAGHGVQYDSIKSGSRFYFCPADADIRNLKSADGVSERNHLLDLTELYARLKRCKAGGKLLLVDACRNDPTKRSLTRSLASNTLPPLPPPPGGTAAFFSCSANQKAFEDRDLKHGVFFYHVIQGLTGAADSSTSDEPADGNITLAELAQHVSRKTYDFVLAKYKGSKQAPELKGEFRLTVPIIDVGGRKAPPKHLPGKKPPAGSEIALRSRWSGQMRNENGYRFDLQLELFQIDDVVYGTALYVNRFNSSGKVEPYGGALSVWGTLKDGKPTWYAVKVLQKGKFGPPATGTFFEVTIGDLNSKMVGRYQNVGNRFEGTFDLAPVGDVIEEAVEPGFIHFPHDQPHWKGLLVESNGDRVEVVAELRQHGAIVSGEITYVSERSRGKDHKLDATGLFAGRILKDGVTGTLFIAIENSRSMRTPADFKLRFDESGALGGTYVGSRGATGTLELTHSVRHDSQDDAPTPTESDRDGHNASRTQELVGIWQQESNLGPGWNEVGKCRVLMESDGQLQMNALSYGKNVIRSRGITNIRVSGDSWTFNSDWGNGDIAKFELKRVSKGFYEGAVYLNGKLRAEDRWRRIDD